MPVSEEKGVSQLLVASPPTSKIPLPDEMKLLEKERKQGANSRSASFLAGWPEAKQFALQHPYSVEMKRTCIASTSDGVPASDSLGASYAYFCTLSSRIILNQTDNYLTAI
jgi:hypothetical protein